MATANGVNTLAIGYREHDGRCRAMLGMAWTRGTGSWSGAPSSRRRHL